jgi:hypothetical protein
LDQRGASRPFDGDRHGTALCDVGAFEFGLQLVNKELTGERDLRPRRLPVLVQPPEGEPIDYTNSIIRFCNIGRKQLTELKSITTLLTGGNILLNRDYRPLDSVLEGSGSLLSFPKDEGYADGMLDAGECVAVTYLIGLATREPFRLIVDVLGVASESGVASTSQ